MWLCAPSDRTSLLDILDPELEPYPTISDLIAYQAPTIHPTFQQTRRKTVRIGSPEDAAVLVCYSCLVLLWSLPRYCLTVLAARFVMTRGERGQKGIDVGSPPCSPRTVCSATASVGPSNGSDRLRSNQNRSTFWPRTSNQKVPVVVHYGVA